jgi:hypothetical protein
MTAWLLTNVLPWLVAGLLALVAILRRAWRKADKQQRTIKDLETDAETRKRMDKADAETIGDDPAVLRDWLRERGQR